MEGVPERALSLPPIRKEFRFWVLARAKRAYALRYVAIAATAAVT